MKKTVLSILLFAFISTEASKAEAVNLRVSPIHAAIGYLNLNLDAALSTNWTVGATYGYWTYNSKNISSNIPNAFYDVKYVTLGLRGNWFYNGVFKDGLFVGPFLNFINTDITGLSGSVIGLSGKTSATNLGCLVGYGWFWSSFNQMLSGGVSTTLGGSRVLVVDSSGSTVDEVNGSNFAGVALEYTIGWVF